MKSNRMERQHIKREKQKLIGVHEERLVRRCLVSCILKKTNMKYYAMFLLLSFPFWMRDRWEKSVFVLGEISAEIFFCWNFAQKNSISFEGKKNVLNVKIYILLVISIF